MKYLNIIKNGREVTEALRAARNTAAGDNRHHLCLAGEWLLKAQSVHGDGGHAHSYSLLSGWERPYPETTGYIIPTMLEAGEYLKDDRYTGSAVKAGEWLLAVQGEDGSFPDLSGAKQVFDTGQILEGLLALYRKTGDERFLDSAVRAGAFLVENQDDDGKWTRFSYNGTPHTYYTKVSANLLGLREACGDNRFKEAAEKNIEWAISQQRDNGYFDFMSFSSDNEPYLHTIMYVLEGLLDSYEITGDKKTYSAFKKTLDRLSEISGKKSLDLYSQYDKEWRYKKKEKCLTGLAQWARLLLDVYGATSEERYLSGALRTIQYLKAKQVLEGSDNIKGSLPGSIPIWGSYFKFSFNNWTVKYFIDALLRAERVTFR